MFSTNLLAAQLTTEIPLDKFVTDIPPIRINIFGRFFNNFVWPDPSNGVIKFSMIQESSYLPLGPSVLPITLVTNPPPCYESDCSLNFDQSAGFSFNTGGLPGRIAVTLKILNGSLICLDNSMFGSSLISAGEVVTINGVQRPIFGSNVGCTIPILNDTQAPSVSLVISKLTYTIEVPDQITTINPIDTSESCLKTSNSYINMDTLSLNENIRLIGTGFNLFYESERLRPEAKFNPKSLGLGGWTLGINHNYNSAQKRIFFGNGSTANVEAKQSPEGLMYVANSSGSELYYFDSTGKHLFTKDSLTGINLYSFNYDNSGRLISIKDQFQKSVSISYLDDSHARIISKYSQINELTFDSNGFLASVKNPNNELTQIQNNSQGYITAFTKPKGQTSNVEYDSNGFVLKDTGAGGDFISLIRSFDADTKTQSVIMSTALDRKTQFITSTPEAGKSIHKVINHDGSSSDFSNVKQGSRSTSNSRGISSTSDKVEDPRFGWMSPYNTNSSLSIANSHIQISSAVTKTVDLSNPNDLFSYSKMITKTILQNNPLRTYISEFDKASKTYSSFSPMGRKSLMQINELNLLTSMKNGNLESIYLTYDDFGRIIEITQGPRITTLSYDQDGNINKVIDPLGKVTSYISDNSGRVIEQIRPDQKSVKFSYDLNGNITSITPPEKPVHSFSYNLFDLIASYSPPQLAGNVSTMYSYNLDKQVTKIQRPDGKIIDFLYSQTTGNLESIQNERGAYSFIYNNSSGLLQSVNSPYGVKNSFQYLGSVLSSSQLEYGNLNVKMNISYNPDLNLNALSVVSQNGIQSSISYLFDNDNLPIKIGDQILNHDTQNGLLTNTSLDKISENITRNNFGEISSSQFKFIGISSSNNELHCKSKSEVFAYSLVRDTTGRIIAKSEKERHEHLENSYYYYDQIGRLEGVKKNNKSTYYIYDANGNRLKKIDGHQIIKAQYDNQDRLIKYGAIEYSYNANGDLVSKIEPKDHGSHYGHFKHHWFQKHDLRHHKKLEMKYFYDSFGNLNKVILPNNDVVEYIIDGQNRRVGKKVNDKLVQVLVYQSQLQIAAELDGQGNILRRYVYGSKINIPDYFIQNNLKYKIISDHLGSPRLIINASSGKIVDEMNFDEFGILEKDYDHEDRDNVEIPFGYAGGLYDEHTGLVRFGARDYDPEVGRWTSKDPIGFKGKDANLYNYSNTNPINMIDPKGTDYYFATLVGHLSLIIDDPESKGEKLTVDFGPKITSMIDLIRMLLGQTIPAEIIITEGVPSLYVPIPGTTIIQSKAEDEALIKDIKYMQNAASNLQIGYNLLGFGTKEQPALNCISFSLGASSK
jgi:RHS repeat-associated protein